MSAIEREAAAPGQAPGAEAPVAKRRVAPVAGPEANEEEPATGGSWHRLPAPHRVGGQGLGAVRWGDGQKQRHR